MSYNDHNSDDHISNASDDEYDTRFSKRSKYECDECNRTFTRRYTLERHRKNVHPESDAESDGASNEESAKDEDSNTSESSDEHSSEEEEEENVKSGLYVTELFRGMVDDVMEEHGDEIRAIRDELVEDGLKAKNAKRMAFLSSDVAKKALRQSFVDNIFHIREHTKHPLHKSIMEKVKDFEGDGLELPEAIIAAVKFRKHALYNLINYL